MTYRTRFLIVTAVASLITASAAHALILLCFETEIKGESTVVDHVNWINIDSVAFDVGRSISAAGGGGLRETSNPSFSEIRLSKSTDVASTQLFFEAIQGKSLGKATIHFINSGGTKIIAPYYIIEAHEAIISSYSASSAGERPAETFTINFSKLCNQYNKFDGDKVTTGTPKCWDLEKNAAF